MLYVASESQAHCFSGTSLCICACDYQLVCELWGQELYFFSYNLITWQSRNPVSSYSTVKHRKLYSIFCNNGKDSEKLYICPYIYIYVCVCVYKYIYICAIHWKLTECCKSIIIQLQKIKKEKTKNQLRNLCLHWGGQAVYTRTNLSFIYSCMYLVPIPRAKWCTWQEE